MGLSGHRDLPAGVAARLPRHGESDSRVAHHFRDKRNFDVPDEGVLTTTCGSSTSTFPADGSGRCICAIEEYPNLRRPSTGSMRATFSQFAPKWRPFACTTTTGFSSSFIPDSYSDGCPACYLHVIRNPASALNLRGCSISPACPSSDRRRGNCALGVTLEVDRCTVRIGSLVPLRQDD